MGLDMTGFADSEALKAYDYQALLEAARHDPNRTPLYLGAIHEDHQCGNFEAGIGDDRHFFIVAGSRSGKGTSLIIPNLARWPGPVFCLDPKGENASIVGMRRGTPQAAKGSATSVKDFMGQNVAILDPLGIVRGPARNNTFQVDYNPLSDIDINAPDANARINRVVEGIIIPDEKDQHWSEGARILLAGSIEAGLVRSPDEMNLPFISPIVSGNTDQWVEFLNLEGLGSPIGKAHKAAWLLANAGDTERGSFSTTLSRQMGWIDDHYMAEHLKAEYGTFSLRQAVQEGWSIFVCLPPDEMNEHKRWLRVILNVALSAKMDRNHRHSGPQTLFMLDEFPILGTFQLIADAAGYMAGYGVKLCPVIQNIGQLKQHYKDNWETFLGNAGGIAAFGLNDFETEEYIAKRVGQNLLYEQSFSAGGFGIKGNDSITTSIQERPIRWPSEIHTQGARRQMRAFVLSGDGEPFTIRRREYMQDQDKSWFDDPEFIKEWEIAYANAS